MRPGTELRLRTFAVAASAAFAIGIGALAASPPLTAAPTKFVMEEFFNGRLRGEGVFHNTWDGSVRKVSMDIRGSVKDREATLVEDIVFSDGERQRKTWIFTRLKDGHYIGRRSDLIGTAEATSDASGIRLKYTARVVRGGSTYPISFDEHFSPRGANVVLNRTTASMMLVNVGRGEATIRKLAD